MEDGSQVMWFSLVTKWSTDCHLVKMAPWFHPIILVEICRLLSMGGKPTLFRCLFIKVQCIDWGFFFFLSMFVMSHCAWKYSSPLVLTILVLGASLITVLGKKNVVRESHLVSVSLFGSWVILNIYWFDLSRLYVHFKKQKQNMTQWGSNLIFLYSFIIFCSRWPTFFFNTVFVE